MVQKKIGFLFIVILLSSCYSKKNLIDKRSKAIVYLESSAFEFDYTYLYAYLSRSYTLPPIHQLSEVKKYTDSLQTENSADSKKILYTMRLYKRLFDPTFQLPSKEVEQSSGLDSLVLTSLYSSILHIDTLKFYRELMDVSRQGQYGTTHSLLSIIFLEENKCIKSPEFDQTKQFIQEQNLAMVNNNAIPWDDIKMESLALLLHSKAKVSPSLVMQALKNQYKDGGWAVSEEKSISDPHTTILGVWILTSLISSK
jgi:hypothetical protein